MRREALSQFHFHSHQIRGPVGILFAALVAAHFQPIIDLGWSFEGISLAQAVPSLSISERIGPL